MTTLAEHGIDGVYLGEHAGHQYTLVGGTQVYRRPIPVTTGYGGWRWECSRGHVMHYRSLYGAVARNLDSVGTAEVTP